MSCQFVADLGVNHLGSWDRALALIHAAKDVGCDAVKFQLARHDKVWAPEVRKSKEHLIPYELPLEWLPEIQAICLDLDIKFGCTPLYLDAVKELEPWVDFYKIASYEARWNNLIDAWRETTKPVVISLGIADKPYISSGGCVPDLTFLHCVPEYPCQVQHANLRRIGELKEKWGHWFKVGYSDHSVNPRVIERAVLHWGAEMVEFHLDLEHSVMWTKDGSAWSQPPGPEAGHSWTPTTIKPVIALCRMDDGVWPGWEEERKWARGKDGLRPTEEAR